MFGLTKEHLKFIEKHRIPLEEVFDANGMKAKAYKAFMQENDYLVAYGVTPCEKAGHTLRTRYGHCVMCDPSKIAFVKRKRKPGYVYIAFSSKYALIKIGCTENYLNRIKSLNQENYGNVNDWYLIGYSYQENMGEVECNIQNQLVKYQKIRPFLKGGMIVNANEIFSVDLNYLRNVLKKLNYDFFFCNSNPILQGKSSNNYNNLDKKNQKLEENEQIKKTKEERHLEGEREKQAAENRRLEAKCTVEKRQDEGQQRLEAEVVGTERKLEEQRRLEDEQAAEREKQRLAAKWAEEKRQGEDKKRVVAKKNEEKRKAKEQRREARKLKQAKQIEVQRQEARRVKQKKLIEEQRRETWLNKDGKQVNEQQIQERLIVDKEKDVAEILYLDAQKAGQDRLCKTQNSNKEKHLSYFLKENVWKILKIFLMVIVIFYCINLLL